MQNSQSLYLQSLLGSVGQSLLGFAGTTVFLATCNPVSAEMSLSFPLLLNEMSSPLDKKESELDL